jgi:hypothetical protein
MPSSYLDAEEILTQLRHDVLILETSAEHDYGNNLAQTMLSHVPLEKVSSCLA